MIKHIFYEVLSHDLRDFVLLYIIKYSSDSRITILINDLLILKQLIGFFFDYLTWKKYFFTYLSNNSFGL